MKKKVNLTTTHENRINDGRGFGHGSEYKPWLRVHDVPSKGRSTRVKGWTTGRIHHFLSDLETGCFYINEWDIEVTDIREQIPLLPMSETMEIAEALGIRHPQALRERENIVMTTDFLIDRLGETKEALNCKYLRDFNDKRILEKFAIEDTYWKRRGINLLKRTEKDISNCFVQNVRLIHKAYTLDGIDTNLNQDQIRVAINEIQKRLECGQIPVQVTDKVDNLFHMEPGTSLFIVRHIIARRVIAVDMTTPIRFDTPLLLLKTEENANDVNDK